MCSGDYIKLAFNTQFSAFSFRKGIFMKKKTMLMVPTCGKDPPPPKRQIVGNNVSAKQSISTAPLLPLAKEKIVTSSTGARQKVDDCDDCFDESIHLTRFLYL